MRSRVLFPGMLAILAAASPVSAQTWAAFHQWSFCSGNALSACMNFELTRNGTTDDYRLLVQYVSAEATDPGVMTSAGLYRETDGPNLLVSNLQIVSTTPTGLIWSLGSNQLNGEGPIVIEVAGNSGQGVNNGLPVGGSLLIGFRSTNLGTYDMSELYARSHIQSYGPNNCSLKPDSRSADNVVGTVSEVDAACGTDVVPEPVTMVLLGSGLLGIGGAARRRRRNALVPKDDEA